MPEQDIKQIIKEEYKKCSQDPIYFIKKYVKIQHAKRGTIPFILYPFQEALIRILLRDENTICLKSRQLGISTLAAAYSLWKMIFNSDTSILCIATKQDTAKNMVTKAKFAFNNLPNWLKGSAKPDEENKLTLKLSNGSQIKATSSASDAGRSESATLLIIDEAAFIDNMEELFASIQQTTVTGGKCFALSTPNGANNWFHKTWVAAELGENGFVPVKLPWTVHPERTQAWRDEQDKLLGPRLSAQECDAEFNSSGATVIEPELLKFIEETWIKPPMERRGLDHNFWVWEAPDYTKQYAVIADVARGDGSDYSVCHVFDIENAVQVAEYKAQVGTTDFGNILVGIATEYNDALLVIENANIGWAVIQQVINRGYGNLYYSPKSDTSLNNVEAYINKIDDLNNMVPGFTTSLKTRPLLISKLESYIRERSCLIQSKRTLEELKSFVWKNGRPEANNGYNDDLVMAVAIFFFIRDTALRLKQQNMDLTRATLGNIQKTSYNNTTPFKTSGINTFNPWEMQVGTYKEGLNWLLD